MASWNDGLFAVAAAALLSYSAQVTSGKVLTPREKACAFISKRSVFIPSFCVSPVLVKERSSKSAVSTAEVSGLNEYFCGKAASAFIVKVSASLSFPPGGVSLNDTVSCAPAVSGSRKRFKASNNTFRIIL